MELTCDEAESLVASMQDHATALGRIEWEKCRAKFTERLQDVLIVDLPGWRLEVCEGDYEDEGAQVVDCVLLVPTESGPPGEAIHVGLIRGVCSENCRDVVADLRARRRMADAVLHQGQVWRLEEDPRYGAPMYVAHRRNGKVGRGWVVRDPYYDAPGGKKRWRAGANIDGSEVGFYRTMRAAMRAAEAYERKLLQERPPGWVSRPGLLGGDVLFR